jgi:hypothetical protein
MGNGIGSLSFNASKDACNHNKVSGKTIVWDTSRERNFEPKLAVQSVV